MRSILSLCAGLLALVFSSTATAGLNISVASDVDTLNLIPDQQFTLTITLTTDVPGEARGLSLRAAGWAPGDLSFVAATIPNFGGSATPTGGLFGLDLGDGVVINGIRNSLPGPVDNGTDVRLFEGVLQSGVIPAASTGPEVFTVTFQASGPSGVIFIGALGVFGDAYVSSVDGILDVSNPSVSIPYAWGAVPEPGTALLLGLGLANLGAVGRRE